MADPIRIPFAGSTNASGVASITVKLPPPAYGVFTLSGECAGNPNWKVASGSESLSFGNGPQVLLGPMLTHPGETITISVVNGAPSVQVTGTLAGNLHATATAAADNYVPATNPLTVSTFGQQQSLGSLVSVNGTVTKSFTPSAGSRALKFAWHSGPATSVSFTVVGDQTGNSYSGSDQSTPIASIFPSTVAGPLFLPIDIAFDTSYTVSLTNNATTFTLFVVASPDIEVVTLQNPVVSLVDFFTQSAIQSDTENSKIQLLVSNRFASPAPWQRRSYDWSLTGTFATSGTPSVAQSNAIGTLVVAYIGVSIITTNGAVVTPQIQLVDSSGPTTTWRHWMLVGTAGTDRQLFDVSNLGYQLFGNATLQWDRAIGANTFATLDMGGYITT